MRGSNLRRGAAALKAGHAGSLQMPRRLLAGLASALLLSITHHVTQNIAAIPLLCGLCRCSLYLLSLILLLRRRTLVSPVAFPSSLL